MEQQTGSKLGKEYIKAVYCHPDYLTYMQSTSWEMPGWMKHKLESSVPWEMSITWDIQKTLRLPQKTKRNKRVSWIERREWKSWLKTQHSDHKDHGNQSHLFMENRWGNNAYSDRIYFLGLKSHWEGDCSHEIKRFLLLGRKAMTKLNSTLKSRDIILPAMFCLVKAMVFPVVVYACECWTIKKAECQRIDVFELWCWRRFLRVPWTARRSNPSILKEIRPEYSLEELMLLNYGVGEDSWESLGLEGDPTSPS